MSYNNPKSPIPLEDQLALEDHQRHTTSYDPTTDSFTFGRYRFRSSFFLQFASMLDTKLEVVIMVSKFKSDAVNMVTLNDEAIVELAEEITLKGVMKSRHSQELLPKVDSDKAYQSLISTKPATPSKDRQAGIAAALGEIDDLEGL